MTSRPPRFVTLLSSSSKRDMEGSGMCSVIPIASTVSKHPSLKGSASADPTTPRVILPSSIPRRSHLKSGSRRFPELSAAASISLDC